MSDIKKSEEPKKDLVTDCCGSTEFDPWGYTREDGLWDEKCLVCGKKTDVHWNVVRHQSK